MLDVMIIPKWILSNKVSECEPDLYGAGRGPVGIV